MLATIRLTIGVIAGVLIFLIVIPVFAIYYVTWEIEALLSRSSRWYREKKSDSQWWLYRRFKR